MHSAVVRESIVIVGGIVIGASLVTSAMRQIRRRCAARLAVARTRTAEAVARLAFGAGLVVVAILLLAGHVLSQQRRGPLDAPVWVVAFGTGLLAVVALSGILVLVFRLLRHGRPGLR